MSTFNLSLDTLRSSYKNSDHSPRELTYKLRQQALDQSEFNAWIHILSEAELEPYLNHLENQSIDKLPLYGVPFAVKDNIDLAGIPTTAACPEFSYIPKKSAPVVELLINVGAIPLGKTNLDQFATGLVGTRSPYGESKNSFNPDYISGGSSAGSAIATALGQVSFALGTDTAGSGRVPAVLNNLIGHKPTKGLLSTRGVVPACRTLDCVSIFALNTNDAALVLDIAARYDKGDPYSRPNTYDNKYRYYNENELMPFRFGIPSKLDFKQNTETEALYQKAKLKLQELGGEAIEIDFSPFLEAAKLLYEGPWVAERWLATKDIDRDSMLDVIRTIIAGAEGLTAADGFTAQYRLQALKKQCDALLKEVEFILTPTTPTIYTREEIQKEPIINNSILGTYTNFMNLLDYSGVAIPVGFTERGVPWGPTLFSHSFRDMKLLRYAGKLQQSCDLKQGATEHELHPSTNSGCLPIPETINVVVCGAHLSGQPLNWQLTERGGKLVEATASSPHYQLYALPDGKRPAMVRDEKAGVAIEIEVWSLPKETFGSFVYGIPAPLGIGKVELADGSWLSGFICDDYGLEGAINISKFGGWRAWLDTRKKG